MSWNYRVFRHKYDSGSEYYVLHEVYYDDSGKIEFWTEEPINPSGESIGELELELNMILKDVKRSKKQILDYDTMKLKSFTEHNTNYVRKPA